MLWTHISITISSSGNGPAQSRGFDPRLVQPPAALVTQRSECGSYDYEVHFVATDNLRRETMYIFLNFCTMIVLKGFFCKSCEIYHSLLPPAGSRTRFFFLEFSFRGNASPRVNVQIESYLRASYLTIFARVELWVMRKITMLTLWLQPQW